MNFFLCPAPIIVGPDPGDKDNNVGEKIPPKSSSNCKIKVPKEGATVKVSKNYSQILIKLSRNFMNLQI